MSNLSCTLHPFVECKNMIGNMQCFAWYIDNVAPNESFDAAHSFSPTAM